MNITVKGFNTICCLVCMIIQQTGLSQCNVKESEEIKLDSVEDAKSFVKTEKEVIPRRSKTAEYQKCYDILKTSLSENDPIRQKSLYYLARSQIFHAVYDTGDVTEYNKNIQDGISNYKLFIKNNKNRSEFQKEINLAENDLIDAYFEQRNYEDAKILLLEKLKNSNKDKREQERTLTRLCNLYGLAGDLQKENYYEKETGIAPRSKNAVFIPDGIIPSAENWEPNVKDLFDFEKRDLAFERILKNSNTRESFKAHGPIKDVIVCKNSSTNPIIFILCRSLYTSEENKIPNKGHLFRISIDGRFLSTGDNIIDKEDQVVDILKDGNAYLLQTGLASSDNKDFNMIELWLCDEKKTLIFSGYAYPRKNIKMKLDQYGPEAKISIYENETTLADVQFKNGEWLSSNEKIKIFTARKKAISPEGIEYEKENFTSPWEPVRKDLADR